MILIDDDDGDNDDDNDHHHYHQEFHFKELDDKTVCKAPDSAAEQMSEVYTEDRDRVRILDVAAGTGLVGEKVLTVRLYLSYYPLTCNCLVVKRLTDIPINRGMYEEKNKTALNFTVPVFLQYVIYCIRKSAFPPKSFDRNRSYFNLEKDFQKRKLIIFFSFPPPPPPPPPPTHTHTHTGACTCLSYYLPQDTPGRPLTPQDALYMLESHLFCSI